MTGVDTNPCNKLNLHTYFLDGMIGDLESRTSSVESSKVKQVTLSSSASFLRERGSKVIGSGKSEAGGGEP